MIAVAEPWQCPRCGWNVYSENTSASCESPADEIRCYYTPTPSPTIDRAASKPPPFVPPEPPRFPKAPATDLSFVKRSRCNNPTLWAAQ